MFPNLIHSANDYTVVDLVDTAVNQLLELKFMPGVFDQPLPTMEN